MENNMTNLINSITSRESMIRYLDGYAAERVEELDERRIKKPLTKSYLLEHTGDPDKIKPIDQIMKQLGISMEMIDDNLYRIYDAPNNYFSFLEILTPRYFVVYTAIETKESDSWVKKLVHGSSELDHVWLSGLTFNVLWERIVQLNNANRFVKIGFMHDSVYQIDKDIIESEADDKSIFEESDPDEVPERRASRISLVDRIGIVQEKLTKLQMMYFPLNAINQLRFPSSFGQGGHDFYDYGKVTNRSGSFRDHRNHVIYVQRVYDKLMELTESTSWYSIQRETIEGSGHFQKLIGAPVTVNFSEPLNSNTFEYWINSTFGNPRNRFRLWGNPIWLGPKRVHVYGVDRHLWQQIFLELTVNHIIAVIPQGTCGNTVHRLVTNIQRYIDPAAKVYIGDKSYSDLVYQSSQGVIYDRKESTYLQ